MAKASISRAWDETRAVMSRDGKAMVAVALALFVLPGLVANLFIPRPTGGVMPAPGLWLVPVGIVLVISLVGQLAIIRIASGTGNTVGDAIAHAAKHAPAYVAATIIWMLPFALLVLFVNANASEGQQPTVGLAVFVLVAALILLFGGLFLFVRMMMLSPVASNETGGPIALIRRSWQLTRGNWWRLFGFFLLFAIAAAVVLIFSNIVAGIFARILGGAEDPFTVGALLVSLVTQLASSAVSLVFFAMIARIYVQLSSGGSSVSVPSTAD